MKRAVLVALLVACASDEAGPPPFFPADYAASYQEVRGCRFSLDHDLMRIRVLAAPDAVGPYMDRTTPFPSGAIVLKEQFAEDDMECAGPILRITAMQKDAAASPALGWQWQETEGVDHVVDGDDRGCIGCHTGCGKAPEGYDGTCTVP